VRITKDYHDENIALRRPSVTVNPLNGLIIAANDPDSRKLADGLNY
jgi:hypothetical protein